MKPILAKLAYAAVFCVGVPLLLWAWAMRLDAKFPSLPSVRSVGAGATLAIGGLALTARAMWDLWRRGGGLPMNAFPPPNFVTAGAYRWVAHPIYSGFGLAVLGVACATGSAAALWIVTPATWLAMVALVVGYERIDLQKRFGVPVAAAWLSRSPAGATPPLFAERITALLLAFVPWLVAYEGCVRLGSDARAIDTMLGFERGWPVWVWTAPIYLGAYVWTAAAPFAATTQAALRTFVRTAWWGTTLIAWCFLTFPFVAVSRPLDASSVLGQWLLFDRALDTSACAFPSFHVFWAFAAASLWKLRIGVGSSQVVAVMIAASCVTTGVHSLLDVIAGWGIYLAASRCDRVWESLRAWAERVANSWHDWRIGRVRIINHGAYVGGAAALGLWLVGILLGPSFTPAVVTVALCSVLGAGLWGQWLEASSQLSRPFGYFGGLFGGCLGAIIVQLCWGEGWQLLGAFAVAAPLIQGVGRMRCLVQGCCHGRPSDDWLGIRYTQPLSRVCKLAKLDGVPIHPTPLYSILGNAVILGLLARLWREGADLAFISGAYFVLSTCARFMEEGYRGEPQTVRWGGLPIYQWLAIGCLLVGIGLTMLPAPVPPARTGASFAPLMYAVPIGLVVWFCMGVDFPESQRRMSRLA